MSAKTGSCGTPADVGTGQVTTPGETADLIDQLRAGGVILTYDPDTQTIRSGDNSTIVVNTDQNH
jgi:hypothetical protein